MTMSKTYILLKDTPFNKAGAELFTTNGKLFSTVGYPVNTLESFTEQDILERPNWFKLKETPKRGRPKKSYTPKVGETVRVVECRFNNADHINLVGTIKDINSNMSIFYVSLKDGNICEATKVEPVEKKQLPSDTVTQIYYHLDMIIQLLDEQHISGGKA